MRSEKPTVDAKLEGCIICFYIIMSLGDLYYTFGYILSENHIIMSGE